MSDLFEHQGKALLAAAGIPVPKSTLVRCPAEAERAAERLGYPLIVKAQVLSGGRGKAGGVRRVASAAEFKHAAEDILRLHIGGKPVVSLLLEQALDIIHEYYLAVALDRAARRPVLLFSPHGGVDVERDAGSSPHGMVRIPIDPLLVLRDFQVRSLVAAAGLSNGLRSSLERAVRVLWKLYLDCDATLVEINPLSVARRERRVRRTRVAGR